MSKHWQQFVTNCVGLSFGAAQVEYSALLWPYKAVKESDETEPDSEAVQQQLKE